jgi:hypothetical protein
MGLLLLAAAGDAFGALALGFGTTVPIGGKSSIGKSSIGMSAASSGSSTGIGMVMVTVEHEILVPTSPDISVRVPATLADVYLQPMAAAPPACASLGAEHHALDRPTTRDEPWLNAVRLSWARPDPAVADAPRVASYALLRTRAGTTTLLLDERASGGFQGFMPAQPAGQEPHPLARFVDRGLAEPKPGDDGSVTWAVAAQDAFGRWSPWASAGHTLLPVATQAPRIRDVQIQVHDGAGPCGARPRWSTWPGTGRTAAPGACSCGSWSASRAPARG